MADAAQVDELLQPPAVDAVAAHYIQLTKGLGLEVRPDAGDGRGKGVFAKRASREGDVLFTEPPLVGIQHSANRGEALVCSNCFSFIGSIEAQVAQRLQHDAKERSGQQENGDIGRDADGAEAALSEDQLRALASGAAQLPGTDAFSGPEPVPCPGGCQEERYCSSECAAADWRHSHRLLCTAEQREQRAQQDAAATARERRRAQAMAVFNEHADATNDVFRLAAKVIAHVLIEARQALEAAAPGGSSSGGGGGGAEAAPEECWAALRAAWAPFRMGHKALWWECVPDGVEDAQACRDDRRQLAADSLELLAAALHDPRFPALFDLRVFGALMGMFELNNLGIYVASPVPRWVDALAALPDSQRLPALEAAGPAIDALGEAAEESACEGNGFFALHSCMNHSCLPNAHVFKRDEDTTGAAVVLALRDIAPREEVTISYIDENAPLEERAEALAEYGFACGCEKCAAQGLAAELALGE